MISKGTRERAPRSCIGYLDWDRPDKRLCGLARREGGEGK